MNEKRRILRKDVKLQPITKELHCSLEMVSVHNLVVAAHSGMIVDRSISGIGVETEHPIDPCIVWFPESVYGQKCGVLMWCQKNGDRYRCGIRFVSLTIDEEEFFRFRLEHAEPCMQIQDPDSIIARLYDCIVTPPMP